MESETTIKSLLDLYAVTLGYYVVAKTYDRDDEMKSAGEKMVGIEKEIRDKIEKNELLTLIRDLKNYNFI